MLRYCGEINADSPLAVAKIPEPNGPLEETVEESMKGDSQLVEIRVRRLAQGHPDTLLGGAGDRTSNLLVTSPPALPPEPHAAESV